MKVGQFTNRLLAGQATGIVYGLMEYGVWSGGEWNGTNCLVSYLGVLGS